ASGGGLRSSAWRQRRRGNLSGTSRTWAPRGSPKRISFGPVRRPLRAGRAIRLAALFEEGLQFGDDFQILRSAGGALQLDEAFQGDDAARNPEGRHFLGKR